MIDRCVEKNNFISIKASNTRIPDNYVLRIDSFWFAFYGFQKRILCAEEKNRYLF
jgi:hypothetical protein